MRAFIGACVRRPIATVMVFIAIVLLGLIGAAGLGVDFLPRLEVPRLVVAATYEGLPAKEVRSLITIPLEDALSSLKGARRSSSISRDGSSSITVDFAWGTDMRMAAVEAREAIDVAYASLPSEASKPIVLQADPSEEAVLTIGVFPRSGDLALARRFAERDAKTRLQQASGVGTITLVGGAEREALVSVDLDKLAARGLSPGDLGDILATSNYDYPAGSIREGNLEYVVKAEGSVKSVEGLSQFWCKAQDSPQFRLGDVASVSLAAKDKRSFFHSGGREGIALLVRKQAGASPVSVSAAVRRELAALERSYGNDFEFVVAQDRARFVSSSISDLVSSTAIGAAVAFVLLLLFVRDLSTALIMISSVPFSIIASLLLMRVAGRTINIMSLGGLAMGIGMMVDNSVVVLENLQKRLVQEGRGVTAENVIAYTHELSSSNIGATVTSVVVFLPVILLPGVLGAVFTDLALSVVFSQVASFAISISLVPVLFLLTQGGRAGKANVGLRTEAAFRRVFRFVYRRPGLLVAVIAALALAGALAFRALPFEFMPAVDTGEMDLELTLPEGSRLEAVEAASSALERAVAELPGISLVYARGGGEKDDAYYQADPRDRKEIAHVRAVLSEGRRPSAAAIAELARRSLSSARLGVPGGASLRIFLPESPVASLLGIKEGSLEYSISGDDQADAARISAEASAALAAVVGPAAVEVYPSGSKTETRLIPDRDAMAKAGVDLRALAEAARSVIDGSYPGRITIDGVDIDIHVAPQEGYRGGPDPVGRILVKTGSGALVRLADIAEVREASEDSALMRIDRKDAKTLSLPFASAGKGATEAAKAREAAARIASSHPAMRRAGSSAIDENAQALVLTFALVLALLYLSLGAQFESWSLPFAMLLSLPLSLLGIFLALFVTGKSLNFDSILGIIVLFGVSVNNTIILYETYKERSEAGGRTTLASIYRGTSGRVRPIVITMLTTVLSMAPVALDFSGRSTQSSMAIAIIGGLFVSTTLTLFVAPRVFAAYLGGKGRDARP